MHEIGNEDHVVREVPVFLSKSLEDQLCLLQYPQRSTFASLSETKILEAKIKPSKGKLHLALGLDTDSECYDPETGELLAEAAEGIGIDLDKYMPDHRLMLDRITLESSDVPKLADGHRYAIGVIKQDQITLTPLKRIIQLKTVYPYLNKAEKVRSALATKESGGGDTEEEDEEATKVTVRFSRGSNTAAKAKLSSYSQRKLEEEELWKDLTYMKIHELDRETYGKLSSTNMESETPFYVLKSQDYLKIIFPKYLEENIDMESKCAKNSTRPLSVEEMKTMSLHDQLKCLFINAKILQHNQILDFMKTRLNIEYEETALLRGIQTVAVLVRGCWVVRSDVIYPENFKSSVNGIPASTLQKCRDVILGQYTEDVLVERRNMMTITRLPYEEVTDILSQFSKHVPKKGWEFLLPNDEEFVKKFPEVVQRQNLIWEMKKSQRIRHTSSSQLDVKFSPPRQKQRRRSAAQSSDDSGAETESERRRRYSQSRRRRNSSRSEVGIPSRVEL